jgi:hypothetical protein
MNIPVEVVITLVTVALTLGFGGGVLTIHFVRKKDCDKRMDTVWERIDGITNVLTGGPHQFEVRLISRKAPVVTEGS